MASSASRSSCLEDLELTGEEVDRLSKAFQDEGFRALFAEYAAELADPAQRALYEAEVAALERQRGVEARFLHPSPGWVLRTSQGGRRRCYLNLCSNPLVGRPQARPEKPGSGHGEGAGGCWWSLPHCLAPGREELGRRGTPGTPRRPLRLVYDVVFHPDTLRLAARSAPFRRLVEETALEAVEKHFAPGGLDRANAVPLRGVKYKGVPQATLLRTPLPGGAPPEEGGGGGGEEGEGGGGGDPWPPFPTPYAYPPRQPELDTPPPSRAPPAPADAAPPATVPRWTLRHRSYVDLQDYRHSRDSAPSPVPRELVVSIELPLLSSAAQAQLEIHEGQELRLDSRRPGADYRLRLRLPYPVDESGGRATFHKAQKQLVVVLPVVAKPQPGLCTNNGQEEPQEPPTEAGGGRGGGEAAAAAAEDAEKKEEGDGASSSPDGQQGDSAAAIPAAGHLGQVAQAPGDRLPPPPPPPLPPALHVGASSSSSSSSAALPVCAAQTGPAAPVAPEPSGSAPPLHVGRACGNPEPPPLCRGEIRASAAAADNYFSVAASPESQEEEEEEEEEEAPSWGLPPGPATSIGEEEEAAAGEPHAPPLRSGDGDGDPVERPEEPGGVATPCCPGTAFQPGAPLPECPAGTGEEVPPPSPGGLAGAAAPPCCPMSSEGPAPPSPAASPVSSLLGGSEAPLPSLPGPPPPPPLPSLASPSPLAVPTAGCLGGETADLEEERDPEAATGSARRCPPFHCTQDDRALTLFLEVPGILPQSLEGEVGTNHYRARFAAQGSASYSFLLQFLPENKLTPPEVEVSVSPSNAVVILAKSVESRGLWTKMYFGPNADGLQERWFVTENNVAEFLGHLPQPPGSGLPEVEQRPLIEVLDVSEGQSLIRLKASDHDDRFQPEPRREEDNESPQNGSKLSAVAENGPEQKSTGSLPARETMGRVGRGPGHCVVLDPGDPRLAVPEEPLTCRSNESEQTSTAGQEAVSVTPAQPHRKEPAQTSEVQGEVHSESTPSKPGLAGTPVPPVIKETNMQDGRVEYISHHATCCPITFQNSLLYELD